MNTSDKDTATAQKIHRALLASRDSLEAAEKWFGMFLSEHNIEISTESPEIGKSDMSDMTLLDDAKIVYGIFDGKNMQGEDENQYPISANYASKSKLIEGDKLKLTIKPNGAFVFKQIELAPRKLSSGQLILEGNQYQVLTDEKTYNVLYASVTFYRGNVGDHVTIIVPEDNTKNWAAIENIIPE